MNIQTCYRCMKNTFDMDQYTACKKCCSHRRIMEKRVEDKIICGSCGEVLVTGMPKKGRSLVERDADGAQTRWEAWRGI